MAPAPPPLKTYTSYPELEGGPYNILYESLTLAGTRMAGEIDATSLDHARAMLESQGHRDILFYSDRIMAVGTLYMREHSQMVAKNNPGAAVRIAGMRVSGQPKNSWPRLFMHATILVLSLVLMGITLHKEWYGVAALFLVIPLYAWFVWKLLLPLHLYTALERARAQCQWQTAIRISGFLRRFYKNLIPPSEMHFAQAGALLRVGRQEDCLRALQMARMSPFVPDWLWASRVSHTYLQMGHRAEAVEIARRGFDGSFKESSQYIDLAHFLIKHGGEEALAEAQALLTTASTMAVTEMARIFYWLAWGMWAGRMGRTEDALGYFYGAEQASLPFSGMWGIQTMMRITQVEKALVLARAGRLQEARQLVDPLRPLLRRGLYEDATEELNRLLPE